MISEKHYVPPMAGHGTYAIKFEFCGSIFRYGIVILFIIKTSKPGYLLDLEDHYGQNTV